MRATCVVVEEERQVDGKGKAEGKKKKENCQASRPGSPARVSIYVEAEFSEKTSSQASKQG